MALAVTKKDASAGKYTDENITNKNIRSLAEKVQLSVSSKWERLYPDKRGATITITDIRNKSWSAEVELAKGEPENPASKDDIYKKFYTNEVAVVIYKREVLISDFQEGGNKKLKSTLID